ncbi:MAG: hypothetical protein ACI4R8_04895 [Candidatus Caccovivens sp.]
MDAKLFTNRDDAFRGFVVERRNVLDSVDRGDFVECFTELCTKAMSGDCVAQDVTAYFFNKGIPNELQPNYEYYLSWEILAGANGNEFAIEKMEFFLNPALETIINDVDLLKEAMLRRNITKDNALMVISNLICEGIVDELHIEAKNLINITNKASRYSPEKNRPFLSAMDKALPKVVKFLLS